MPSFGKKSKKALDTCHYMWQVILNEAIRVYDFSVICGHRGEEDQNELYPKYSKKRWPHSKHNSLPSLAVDLAPYPTDWDDLARFYILAGIVKAIAFSQGIKIRWGGDWDSDDDLNDETFRDLGHFELILQGGA